MYVNTTTIIKIGSMSSENGLNNNNIREVHVAATLTNKEYSMWVLGIMLKRKHAYDLNIDSLYYLKNATESAIYFFIYNIYIFFISYPCVQFPSLLLFILYNHQGLIPVFLQLPDLV